MKPLPIYKWHPVIYFYVVSIFLTAQVIWTCLVGNRPCSSVCLPAGFWCSTDDICFCHKYSIFVQPQMLVIQTYFYIASVQIICTVTLHATDAVYRISCNCSTTRKICQQLLQFSILIDLKSIFIIGYRDIISIGCVECTWNIDGIILRCKILYIRLHCFLINIQAVICNLQPCLDCSCINYFRRTSQCICNCSTAIFIQLIIQFCNFILHFIRNRYRRLLIDICIQCDLNIPTKKLQPKIIIQHLIYIALKSGLINFISLHIIDQNKLLLLFVILNRCIHGCRTLFTSKIRRRKSFLFLFFILLDLICDLVIFLRGKDLSVCFPRCLQFCKLTFKC